MSDQPHMEVTDVHWLGLPAEEVYPMLPDGKPSDGRGNHACEQCVAEGIHCPATVEVGGTYLCRTCQREVTQQATEDAATYAAMTAEIRRMKRARHYADSEIARAVAEAEKFRRAHSGHDKPRATQV